jgi:hypothetical protein
MRGSFILVAAIAMSTAAWADTPPSGSTQAPTNPQKQPIYRSIWNLGDNGAITHLQSGLVCDAEIDQLQRLSVLAFKPNGLDVGCDYATVGKDATVTEYITRRGAETLTDDLAEARSELLHRLDGLKLLRDSQSKDFAPGSTWLKEIYSRSDGKFLEGIWLSDIGGWTLEYRVTYRPDHEAVAFSELAALWARAEATAGAHLVRCAQSASPIRDGVAVENDTGVMAVAFTASAMLEGMPEAASKFGPDVAAVPVEWCVETSVGAGEESALLWHGLNASGVTADADRVSLITTGAPLILESRADSELNKIESELKRTDLPIYAVTTAIGDEDVDVLAFYARRPNGPTLARLMSDFIHRKAKVPARYNRRTKKITIATP